ncbi:MAG: hypothetical protein V1908_02455 [Candidatus Peregrinibacteria bacterium]
MTPNVIFFIAFFLAFSLLELMLIVLLNRFARGHWVFFIDKIIRFQVHHRNSLRWFAYGSLFVAALFLFYSGSLGGVLFAATPELRWFSLSLAGVMILIYLLMTRRASKLAIERRIHTYLYALFSLFLFAFIVVLADQMYGSYQEWMNDTLIRPTVRQVQQTLDQQQKNVLLEKFQAQAKAGECQPVDYRAQEGEGLKQFVFVASDPDLIASDYVDGMDISTELRGQACTDGENTFLLKRDGSWYWVISS